MADAAPAPQQPAGLAPTAGIVRDEIYITDNVPLRTIAVSAFVPETMARQNWRVDDFDLHKELYRGKTSLLYSATDRRSGIPVALKLYRKRKLSTLNKYQVEREIRIHVQLDHVNIIKLYAAFEDEKNVYMVQEFAGGGDLFEDLKRNGGSIKEKYVVRDIIVPFMNALQYLHGMGIIHRDIKPENILLTSQKVIKIADFGLSINYTQERPVTRAGTLDYMAPEVLICPDKRRPEENKDKVLLAYTAQVDAWAVGILCYELLVGYPPFEQESRAATYEYIMYKEPKFPGWMTEDARKFISLALCKNATQRPTIRDLGQQQLILTYAKPVDKPVELRLPQDFLVERSPRSVVGSPAVPSSPTTSPSKAANSLLPLAARRPAAITSNATGCADDAGSTASVDGLLSPMLISPPGLKEAGKALSPAGQIGSRQGSTASSMVMDDDASYSVTEFGNTLGPLAAAAEGGASGHSNTASKQAGITRGNSLSRLPGSPLVKSRLGVSHGGNSPISPHSSVQTPQVASISKASSLQRHSGGVVRANSGGVVGDGGLLSSGDHQGVGDDGQLVTTYSRPQDGVLSTDTHIITRQSGSGAPALAKLPSISPMVRSNSMAQDMHPHAGGGEHGSPSSGPAEGDVEQEERSSKYTKLFAKMWGGGGGGGQKSPQKSPEHAPTSGRQQDALQGSSAARSVAMPSGSMSPRLPLRSGAVRNLHEELMAERADSVTLTDRTGSVLGAPSMNFKKPSAAAAAGRAGTLGSGGGSTTDHTFLQEPQKKGFFASLADEGGGPQRMNSEATLARVVAAPQPQQPLGGAKSFTTANTPAMKKLANAPIVNKIQEYVQGNGSAGALGSSRNAQT